MKEESKTGFEKITDKGLVNFNSSDVRGGDRVVAESNRRLKIAIQEFNKNSSKQSRRIFWLTIAIGIIATLQLILLITQI